MNPLLQMSGSEIAKKIRERYITPSEAVEAHITRIMHVNPKINAVITPMYEQARQQAKEKTQYLIDHRYAELPPLFGVPITVKDCFPIAGVRFTGGSWHLQDNIADETAQPVQKLIDAGAIILGKTNLPDMCWSADSVNPVFGRTNNPHHLKHTAGGSSGGEGAIIAAGGSPLGLGSDIAGSVRVPAAMNGCVSLKPTGGRIPPDGHVPMATGKIKDWNTAGPMARRVEDLALGLTILSETPTQNYREIDLRSRRCTVYIHNPVSRVQRDLVETIAEASATLRHAGMDVVRDDTLPIVKSFFLYMNLIRKHGNAIFKQALGGGHKPNLLQELRRNLTGKGEISIPTLMWTYGTIDTLGIFGNLIALNSFDKLEKLKQVLLDAMGDGVLLTLVMNRPATRHFLTLRPFWVAPYTMMFNMFEFPAVVIPIRYGKKSLPLAVQVVAPPYEDERALAVASELERIYGGWQMAKL